MSVPFGCKNVLNINNDISGNDYYYINYTQTRLEEEFGSTISNLAQMNSFLEYIGMENVKYNLYYQTNGDTSTWKQFGSLTFPISSLKIKVNLGLLFRYTINGNQYGFNYKTQPSNSADTRTEDNKDGYEWKNRIISEGIFNLTRPHNDGYNIGEKPYKIGYGNEPVNLCYRYIDGAFRSNSLRPDGRIISGNIKPKTLQDRMKYVITYSGGVLTVKTYRPVTDIAWNEIADDSAFSEEIINTTNYTLNGGSTICIVVCQPAEEDNQPNYFMSNSYTFKAGKTEFYYIDCEQITNKLVIECSWVKVVENTMSMYPYVLGLPTVAEKSVTNWYCNLPKNIPFFTANEIKIKDDAQTYKPTRVVTESGGSWTGIVDYQIDNDFKDKMPSTFISRINYTYEYPYFYAFYRQQWYSSYDNNGISLFPANILLKNTDDHRWSWCSTVPSNFYGSTPGMNLYNWPGIGDFKKPSQITFSNTSKLNISINPMLQFDAHTLNLCPFFSGAFSVDGTKREIKHGILLPSMAACTWKKNATSTIRRTSTPYKIYTNDDVSPHTFENINRWLQLQNTWYGPIAWGEDEVRVANAGWWNSSNVLSGYTASFTSWHWNTITSYDWSFYDIGPLNSFANAVRTYTKDDKTTGMYLLSWWKNTCSIPVGRQQFTVDSYGLESDLKDFLNADTIILAKSDPRVPLLSTGKVSDTDYQALKTYMYKYTYAYPMSSQAPGAIAIYEVTWDGQDT